MIKVTAIITNWVMKTAFKMIEAHIDSRKAVARIRRDYFPQKWMQLGDHRAFFEELCQFIEIDNVNCQFIDIEYNVITSKGFSSIYYS